MTGSIPALWLGDLAKAQNALQPQDEATARCIAALLGLRAGVAGMDVPKPFRPKENFKERVIWDRESPAAGNLTPVRPTPVERLNEGGGFESPWGTVRVLVGHANGTLTVENFDRKEPVFRAAGSGFEVRAVAASADGRYALTIYRDATPLFSDLRSNAHLGLMPWDYGRSTALALTPDATLAAFGTDRGTVTLWTLRLPEQEQERASPEPLRTLQVFSEEVTAVAFRPQSRHVAVGSANGLIELWDIDSGERRATSFMHKAAVTALAFTPDGRWIVSGAADAYVSLWDVDGEIAPRMLGIHDRRVQSIAISPDGRRALSVAAGSILLWDLNSDERTNFHNLDHERPMAAAFGPNGRPVLLHVRDDVLELLELDPVAEAPRSVMTRPLSYQPSVITVIPTLPNAAAGTKQEPLAPSAPWTPGEGPTNPLVAPHRLPAMLRDLLATESADGPPDADTLVEWIARGEPIRSLPRRKWRTLRRGVQVLEDWSEPTLAFRRDMEPLRRQLDRLFTVAPPTFRFRRIPDSDDLIGVEEALASYRPPRLYTPVLVVGGPTDLAEAPIGNAASRAEWRRFAERHLKKNRCPLVLLSPFVTAAGARHRWRPFERVVAWEQKPPAAWASPSGASIGKPGRDAPFALHALWQRSAQAYQLAVLLSLATRVEPRLVRAMRHRLLPQADARSEAVLWQSGVVYAAVPEAFEFTDGEQRALFTELARDGAILDAAWGVIRACHDGYPKILEIEEEARYRALRRRRADREWLSAQFARIAATVELSNRRGLAGWVERAFRSLPEDAILTAQSFNVQGLARATLTRKAPGKGRVSVGWADRSGEKSRRLVLRHEKPDAASSSKGTVIEVPAGSPLVLHLVTGSVGERRRSRQILLSHGAQQAVPVPRRGSVELVAGDGSRWLIQDNPDVVVVIGYYGGDAPLALELAADLRRRGVVVRKLIDISTEEGALEATQAAKKDKGIALLGPAARPFISRPGLHTRGPDPILVTKGLLPSDLPERLRGQERFDLNLPATGLERLIRRLDSPEWEDDDWWERSGVKEPRLAGWPSARIHGIPPSGHRRFRPALKTVLAALDEPNEIVVLSGRNSQDRLAAAAALARVPAVRRRFSDGIFFVPAFTEGFASWVLRRLDFPVDRLKEGESLEVAREVLRESRCLVMIAEVLDTFDTEQLRITGRVGRTVIIADPSSLPLLPPMGGGLWSGVDISAMRERTVVLRYASHDGSIASRMATSLQVAGVPVWLSPVGKATMPVTDPEVILLTPEMGEFLSHTNASPLKGRPAGWPLFVLRRGWDGPLPTILQGATVLDVRMSGWAELIAHELGIED